jgi:uncharacterized protein
MPDFIVGSPVRGDDFWFREEFVKTLWESIEKHNVLLIAPRRIGKTSVMYRMLDYPENDWLVMHMNVEDIKIPAEFFITIVDAIHEYQPVFFKDTIAKGWDFFKGFLSTIEQVEAYDFKIQLRKKENLIERWEERADQLIERIILSGRKILFIIDELPDMLNNLTQHYEKDRILFLHWFRKIRERSLKARVRWLVGGSVNLFAVLDQKGDIKLINDLKPEVLRPFTKTEVNKFVKEMFKKERVAFDETGVLQKIAELLGSPIPLFLQMLSQELCRAWKREPAKPLCAETVITVFNKTLLGEMARDKLQHYRSRIDAHYPIEEREGACRLLNTLSMSKDGVSRKSMYLLYAQTEVKKTAPRKGVGLNQAFQRLLLHLQSDFYIEETRSERFDFASRLIKTWWRKNYGFEYGDE